MENGNFTLVSIFGIFIYKLNSEITKGESYNITQGYKNNFQKFVLCVFKVNFFYNKATKIASYRKLSRISPWA